MTNHIFKLGEGEGIPNDMWRSFPTGKQQEEGGDRSFGGHHHPEYHYGAFAKKMGVEEGIVFKRPTLEFSYKNDDLHDPFINKYYALSLELATEEEIDTITEYAFKVNEVMKKMTAWASTWWTLRSSSAATRARSSWLTRSPRIPAVSGIRRPMRS